MARKILSEDYFAECFRAIITNTGALAGGVAIEYGLEDFIDGSLHGIPDTTAEAKAVITDLSAKLDKLGGKDNG